MGRLQKEQKYLSFPSKVSLSGVFILSSYRISTLLCQLQYVLPDPAPTRPGRNLT